MPTLMSLGHNKTFFSLFSGEGRGAFTTTSAGALLQHHLPSTCNWRASPWISTCPTSVDRWTRSGRPGGSRWKPKSRNGRRYWRPWFGPGCYRSFVTGRNFWRTVPKTRRHGYDGDDDGDALFRAVTVVKKSYGSYNWPSQYRTVWTPQDQWSFSVSRRQTLNTV